MKFTKDEVAAFMRHVYTAGGSATAVAVVFGLMSQGDADKIIEALKQLGEGMGVVIGALAALLPLINAVRAGRSASPEEQIRKVQQNPDNGVAVVPVTDAGAKTLEKIGIKSEEGTS